MESSSSVFRRALRGPARLMGDLRALSHIVDPGTFLRYGSAVLSKAGEVVRTRSLVPADRAMNGRLRLQVLGAELELDGVDFSGVREMYARKVYFAEPSCQPTGHGWALDLGANRGLFTLLAAKLGHRVLAVEAQSQMIPEIEARLLRNGCRDRVVIKHGLVGAGKGVFADQAKLEGASHYGEPPPVYDLEDLLVGEGIDRLEFVKMDIEGSEFSLQANPGWLRFVQRIAMEVHSAFGDVSEMVALLEGAGFEHALRDSALRPASSLPHDGYLYAWRR